MKMGKSLVIMNKEIAYKLIVRRVENHNNRFAGVPGKKASLDQCLEVFNRGVFRAKNYGVDEENVLIRAGWSRLKSYMWLLRNGYPKVASDIMAVEDYDVLPKGHRMFSKHQTYHFDTYNFFDK
jgi:hypothetical protein